MAEDVRIHNQPRSPFAVTGFGWMAYAIAAVVVVLDQVSKAWILNVLRLPDRAAVRVLPFFDLNMVWNKGVSFGLLRADTASGRWILVLFALAVVVALAIWARTIARPLTAASLGLVIGGAVGNNLIDRVRFGAVADFLDFHVLHFPWVFNLADSAISVGVALLLLDSFVRQKSDGPA